MKRVRRVPAFALGTTIAGLLRRRVSKLKHSYSKRRDRIAKSLDDKIRARKRRREQRKRSVLFIGYAEGALGLGEAFRNMLQSLDDADFPFSIYPYSRDIETRIIGPFMEDRYDLAGTYDINVIYLAANQLSGCLETLDYRISEAGYNILRTYWELPLAPMEWAPLLEKIDELWVPNSFVAVAFGAIFRKKITIVPVCVKADYKTKFSREYFGLDLDRLYFTYSFDYYSSAARKNPLGVAHAFIYAFPKLTDNVGLILKATGPQELDPTAAQLLKNLSQVDSRIRIFTTSMTRDELLSLLDVSDCYVSLHRSEGFGLGMAECLAMGKPVIGTDFSGNQEYLNVHTGFPVPFVLRPLMPGEYPMGDGQSWAEPDLQFAIRLMRSVVNDPLEGRKRGAAGRQFVQTRYSAAAVARIVTARIAEIRAENGFSA